MKPCTASLVWGCYNHLRTATQIPTHRLHHDNEKQANCTTPECLLLPNNILRRFSCVRVLFFSSAEARPSKAPLLPIWLPESATGEVTARQKEREPVLCGCAHLKPAQPHSYGAATIIFAQPHTSPCTDCTTTTKNKRNAPRQNVSCFQTTYIEDSAASGCFSCFPEVPKQGP